MAEAVLNIVQGKLADIIANEAQLLGGVRKKVEWAQSELTRIKGCLQDADSKRKDERVQTWLNDLRDVAYRIEDATDTFFLKVGYRDASFLQKLKKLCNKPKELYFRHKLGTELDNLLKHLEEISESRVRYGIQDLQDMQDNSKGEADVIMPHRRATYQEVDETEVVGMQADKNNILKLLHPDQTPRRAIITIVGSGGLGKTTLAHMVYKSARANFNYHIMLSISQKFSLTDLLGKMLSKDYVRENQEVGDLINELKSFLSNRRYLIILDDVWRDDLWNQLKYALPDIKNGSRVLITSRFADVATSADSQMIPYKLNLLDGRESLDLLLKKALPYQEPAKNYPIDLLELADKLSKKCKGLPLALVVLGGILLTKELSYPAWERVLQIMHWPSHGSACMQILEMSYEDMPYYLKACFQYLACFPEDYKISAKSLIRMWVAEGFIQLEGRPTIEMMAEDCLEELANRSMVQVLSRSTNGLIKYFKVHDILRDLAMDKAGHENFVTVFSHASNDTKPDRIIRRASLQAEEKNSQFMEYVGPNTRSLLLFGTKIPDVSLHCSNFRLLKVLEIMHSSTRVLYLELKYPIYKLIHLKYLRLSGCTIDLSSFSFHRMKRLETLDVRGSNVGGSGDFWTIGTLMHVLAGYLCSLNAPISIATLSNLQTLKWVTVKGAFDWKLPNLRKLGIKNESDEWVSITNLLQTLPFLVSLGIIGDPLDLPMEIVYPKALPDYQNLQSLFLKGRWPKNVNVEASLFPTHLVKLLLNNSRLNHNPMPELGKLNSLKKLYLGYRLLTEDWEGPIICPEGFPALQYLRVYDDTIKDLTVAEGVMPKLTYLQVYDSNTKVHLPPKLQHVTVE